MGQIKKNTSASVNHTNSSLSVYSQIVISLFEKALLNLDHLQPIGTKMILNEKKGLPSYHQYYIKDVIGNTCIVTKM